LSVPLQHQTTAVKELQNSKVILDAAKVIEQREEEKLLRKQLEASLVNIRKLRERKLTKINKIKSGL
jgi:hypothetical protein